MMEDILKLTQENFLKSEPCKRIEYLRKTLRMTQEEMAEKCITTQKCIWSWENGRAFPIKRNRRVIAKVLGVKEEIIFGSPKKYDF